LDEEEAVAVRNRSSAFHLSLLHNQLLPECGILSLKLETSRNRDFAFDTDWSNRSM